ncbi:hypothetical protein [Streptomyces alkaliphilus]|uniref:hypothetical protein n=1 Tax=Streptomyces alkaliphilus TaxID=1472722 RepID=UPI00117F44D8|nr:hypothetical protein [Streptomyces alkaliphilus]MQS08056.1 hypothetical protein [Streptomyces alkaliphilus]
MTNTQLIEGWVFPALFALLPLWTWYAKRYLMGKARAKADDFLDSMRTVTSATLGADPAPSGGIVESTVRRWYAASTLALGGSLFVTILLLYFSLKMLAHANPHQDAQQPFPSPPEFPPHPVFAFLIMYILISILLIRGIGHFLNKLFFLPAPPRLFSSTSDPIYSVSRYDAPRTHPVVRVLQAIGACGEALQLHKAGLPPQGSAVSIKYAEKAVYRAWRTSGRFGRRWQHLEARRHAEAVVAALRFEERRQHEEPGEALKELVKMLTQIATRMAEGRYLCLLDEAELKKGANIRTFPMLRLVTSGVGLLGLLGLGVWSGLPEILLVPAMALATAVIVPAAFRVPVPGAAFVSSLFQRP